MSVSSPEIPAAIDAVLQTGDASAVLVATLDHFDCQAGTVHFLRDGLLHLSAHVGIPPQVAAIVETVPIGKGIAGLAAERRAPVTICNLQTDTSGQARPGARATGMEGSIAVPMLDSRGDVRGVFGVAKASAYDWSDHESGLLLAIGAHLAQRPQG